MAVRYSSKLEDPQPVVCSIPGCGSDSTILHELKPYCGKHALAALEVAEQLARPGGRGPSVLEMQAAAHEPEG